MPAAKKTSEKKSQAVAKKISGRKKASDEIEGMRSLSQEAAAWLVSLTARRFRDLDAPRNASGTYDARDVAKWLADRIAAEASQNASGDDAALLAGEATPGLERLRLAKASLAELELEERRERLIDLEAFHGWWVSEVAADVRKAIEVLRQRFGSEAADIIVAAIDRADGTVAQKTASVPPSPGDP